MKTAEGHEVNLDGVKYPIIGYAPGYYTCICTTCKQEFKGDKRAVQCLPCALNIMMDSNMTMMKELTELRQQSDYWKRRFEAAEDYINHEPDLVRIWNSELNVFYKKWQKLVNQKPE